MKLVPTKIPGAFVIAIERIHDQRGYFARTYCFETLHKAGSFFGAIRQASISFNVDKGTLRGLHVQTEPALEARIVRVSRGRVFDCLVDLRRDSPSHLQWFGMELDTAEQNALLIPAGCAHGFLTLTDDCVVEYLMDADYVPELGRGYRWNDPSFDIAWPASPTVISERDRAWPDYAT